MSNTAPSPQTVGDHRRYRILGVLGHGGFGTVYHARMEGPDGFVKEVAIKLLSDPNPDPELLARFRDEARILGRLRDRAIVSVDPPTRLASRWAVVMEFVDGIDCRRALREHGRLPALVALGIVEEVARTLHNLWNHVGDDGAPMRLLHRDIKPSNIQITPSGDVKVLDFGVARADFDQRESTTSSHISGTRGYIAPERLEGVEDHRGDIYSLGVVLEELLTGLRPSLLDGPQSHPFPVPEEAIALARSMRDSPPDRRPVALQVEERCSELIRKLASGESPPQTLRVWARENVRPRSLDPKAGGDIQRSSADDLVGQTLSQTLPRISFDSSPSSVDRSRLPLLAALALVVLLAASLVVSLGAGSVGVLYLATARPIERPSPLLPPIELPAPEFLDPTAPALPKATGEPAEEEPPAAETPDEPAEAPKPPKPPKRRSAPVRPSGQISQTGAESIELRGAAGRFSGGQVPAGSYSIFARFPEASEPVPAGTVEVTDGSSISLRCDARFKRCRPQ